MAERSAQGVMSRAQQFEDEKKRIMQSCFAKQDTDGSLLESYITHCRIVEDSSSPSHPPADGITKGSQKDRLIFVAVRKSGRVRMHKARENQNGTFSIGKTWNLDDLQTIQVHGPPNEKGFTVTILKPYYWQAGSSKEKDFFISSLIKIYKKYTGGKIPELVGFKQNELETLLGPDYAQLMAQNQQDRTTGSGRDGQHIPHPIQVSSSTSSTAEKPIRAYAAPPSPAPRPGPPLGPAPRPEIRTQRSAGDLALRRPELPPVRPPTADRERPGDARRPSGGSITTTQSGRLQEGRTLSNSRSERDMRPGSSTSNGTSRSGSRPPPPAEPEGEKDIRRVPSIRERLRAPSNGSQTSDPSRRQEEQQDTAVAKPSDNRQRSLEPGERPHGMASPRSHGEIASRFKQAANAYTAAGVLGASARPKTPTTPRSATPTGQKEPPTRSLTDPVPSVPPLRFGEDKRPSVSRERSDLNGATSPYSTSSRGRPSLDEARSPTPKTSMENTPSVLRAGPPPGPAPRPQPAVDTPMALRPGPPAAAASRSQQESDTPSLLRAGPAPSPTTLEPESSISKTRPPITREVSEPTPSQAKQMAQPVPTVSEPIVPLEKVRSAPPSSQHPLVTPPPQLKPKRLGDTIGTPEAPKSPTKPAVVEPKEKTRARSQSRGAKEKKKRHQKKKSVMLAKIDKRGLTVDLDELLDEFHWDGAKSLATLQSEVKKELSKVESNNVIINLDHDGRVDQLSAMLDNAIQQCEEMDGLLTLYAVELSSLNDDIFHIESQSQGLQVQTANQKTLQKELGDLLDTISISPSQLNILKQGALDDDRGLRQIEETLVLLYKAVRTIDGDSKIAFSPTSPHQRRGSFSDTPGIGSMRALQDKKDDYRHTSRAFLARVHQFLHRTFAEDMQVVLQQSRQQQLDSIALSYGNRPHLLGHQALYSNFWRYAPMLAFVRDIDPDEYVALQQLYEKAAKHLFQEEFREHVLAWKKITKKLTADEADDLVFTTTEKEIEHSAVTAARKLTVKKSIARIRGDSLSYKERPANQSIGIVPAHESFQGAFTEITQLVLSEQNFITEYFAMSSKAPQDFLDFVAGPDSPRMLGDLGAINPPEQDKIKAKQVLAFMKELFSFLPQELQGLVDWVIGLDPTQAVGAMYAIEQRLQKLQDSNQEFLEALLKEVWKKLQVQWKKFVEEQVRAIEETKVKVKKRKGVVGFIRVFPAFAVHVEAQLATSTNTPVRQTINDTYTTLNTAIFDTLLTIAQTPDAPSSGHSSIPATPSTPSDPEDKYALNHHITLIENFHHYITALSPNPFTLSSSSLAPSSTSNMQTPHSPSFAPSLHNGLSHSALTSLQPFLTRAQTLLTLHIAAYTHSILHRPVGKLMDFISALESVLTDPSTTDPSSIPNSRPQFSRHAFKKILREHDGKEIRKGIEALKKRVEKHFCDDDDDNSGSGSGSSGRMGHRRGAGDRSSGISIRSGSGSHHHLIGGGGSGSGGGGSGDGSPSGAASSSESQELVRIVLDKCEEELIQLHKRTMLVLVGTPYKDMGLEMEFTVADVRQGFKK